MDTHMSSNPDPDVRALKIPKSRLGDVAALAGVGIATVDRVMNERGNVSEKTALKVLEAARQLNLQRTLPSTRHRNVRIEVILRSPDDEYFSRLNRAFSAIAGGLDRSIILYRNSVDERRPHHLVQHILSSSADALIIYSGTANAALLAAIDDKTRRGIPVLTINNDLPESSRTVHIGADHYRMGRTAAFFMSRMAPKDGALILVRHSEGYKAHHGRVAGFLEGIAERRPDLRVVEILSGQDQTTMTYQLVQKALTKHDDVVGIYNAGGGRGGVATAIDGRGLTGKITFIAHELTEKSSAMLRQGILTLALDQNPEEQARQALGYLLAHFNYTEGFSLSPIPFSVISEETIENYRYGSHVPT
jgi:LacI family transcriptional regulator